MEPRVSFAYFFSFCTCSNYYRLANPVHQALFSYDRQIIASRSKYDQTVKIWKRLSFDIDNVDFDFSYLPHPGVVTSMRWRIPFHRDQATGNTLHTTSSDGVLRIWAPFDSTDPYNLQLWLNLDLYEHSPAFLNSKRFAFIIDNKDVSRAIESAMARSGKSNSSSLENAVSLAQKGPELCVVFDEKKLMTVFSIEGLDHKSARLIKVDKIVENLVLPKRFPIESPELSLHVFSNGSHASKELKDLSFIVHDFRGVLLHYCAHFDTFLDSTVKKKHLTLKAILTGHNKSIQRLHRTADGKSLLSMSRFSENYLWSCEPLENSQTLSRKSAIEVEDKQPIRKAVILNKGDFLVTLIKDKIIVWDCRTRVASAIGHKKLLTNEAPLAFILLPESDQSHHGYHIFSLHSNKTGNLWRISLPIPENDFGDNIITDLGKLEFPLKDDIHLAVRVDPVGWEATVSDGNLNTFQRDVLATISPSGCFRSWTGSLNKSNHIEWLETAKMETGKEAISRMEVSSIKKVAIANKDATELSIWDLKNQILEFQKEFPPEYPISDLDWTSTPDSQSILAVGSERVVTLYSQLRFDYTNKTPAWAPVKTIDISQYTTHFIGDSIWLGGGGLALGAGNQLFIPDNTIDMHNETTRQLIGKQNVSSSTNSLFEACSILNGPLPIYHPQLLIQSIFGGKIVTVKKILCTLLKALKFGVVLDSQVIDIESTLGLTPLDLLTFEDSRKENGDIFTSGHLSIDDALEEFNENVCLQILDWLHKVSLPYMTQHQQITLASVIEAINQVDQNSRSLDENGVKFLLGYRLYKVHRGIQESMTIRDFNWAMHCESQDILLGLVENPSTPLMWPNARELGLPYWVRADKLKEIFEKLGRNHFTNGNRDPVGCSLYYFALKKKQVLIGLWRTAGWNKEQTKTIKLLSNDFELPKYKTTAQKNAFALLGKHRYEYAAAFFLLGDSLKDCVNVLAKQVGDIALAIAVARVYGGDDHPVFKDLIVRHVLPKAVNEGDRWMTTWAFWKLGRQDLAVRALVQSPREMVAFFSEVSAPVDELQLTDDKLFLSDDPVLIHLYQFLQKKNSKAVLRANLSPQEEFQFVLKTASIYSRMGCELLALNLVKNWEFIVGKGVSVNSAKNLRSPVASKIDPEKVSQSASNPFGIDDGIDYSSVKKATPAPASNPFGIDDSFDYTAVKKAAPASNPFGIDDGFDYSAVKKAASTSNPFGIDDGFDYSAVKKAPAAPNSFGISDDFNYDSVKKQEQSSALASKENGKPDNETVPSDKEENKCNEDESASNPIYKNLKPAAASAFQEPDMSAFDFGF